MGASFWSVTRKHQKLAPMGRSCLVSGFEMGGGCRDFRGRGGFGCAQHLPPGVVDRTGQQRQIDTGAGLGQDGEGKQGAGSGHDAAGTAWRS